MIVVWLALGLVVGFAAGVVVVPVLGRRPVTSRPSFRAAAPTPLGTPAPARRLDELTEAVRAAALRVRVRRDGFDVLAQPSAFRDHVVSVRVADPDRVTLTSLRLTDTGGYDLAHVVALALVPLYGPIVVEESARDTYLIDGTLDQHALRLAKAARVTERMRELVGRMR